jgi:dihydrolipoamide dehydrogenase
MRKHKIDVFAGTARFLNPARIGVSLNDGSDTELGAKHALIATGSAPRSVPGVTIDNVRILDSTGALALEDIPRSIVILGSGAVGVEFASLFHALGSEVTLVELLPTLLPLEDTDIGRGLERIFTRKGMKVYTGTTVSGVAPRGDRLAIALARGQEAIEIEANYLLVAVGRAPLINGLGLEAAGVAADRGAVTVDADLRTSAPNIYAAGDVIGGLRHRLLEATGWRHRGAVDSSRR